MEDLNKAMDEASTFLDISGCYIPVRSLNDKDRVVDAAVKFQVVVRTRMFIERFLEGLSALGVLDQLRKYPEVFRPIFCFRPAPLTAELIQVLFKPVLPVKGHHKRDDASVVLGLWYDYVGEVEEGGRPTTLKDILFFITGCVYVPPLGFQPEPSVGFHEEGKYPLVSVCDNRINLPLFEIADYDIFKCNMDEGVLNAMGFGRS
ncbi:G2/M phase-specific E3 ubiquitin-protein ligase-like [Lineus longissimus]|uniref:G2/M phase-specific E3 ubiquitin-protein ligase-like n=1 Tax=Lineus longissimus TaxID=88925 RepID=UPI00315D9085